MAWAPVWPDQSGDSNVELYSSAFVSHPNERVMPAHLWQDYGVEFVIFSDCFNRRIFNPKSFLPLLSRPFSVQRQYSISHFWCTEKTKKLIGYYGDLIVTYRGFNPIPMIRRCFRSRGKTAFDECWEYDEILDAQT
jgi:hypothetical protein